MKNELLYKLLEINKLQSQRIDVISERIDILKKRIAKLERKQND